MNSERFHANTRSTAPRAADGGQTLITRRRLLFGAAGLGAAAAIGVGAFAMNAPRGEEEATAGVSGDGDAPVVSLEVPESSLITLNDFEALEDYRNRVTLEGSYDLKYGTLVWADDDDVATCLIPTDKGSPLAQIGLLDLKSGNVTRVRSKAVGAEERPAG